MKKCKCSKVIDSFHILSFRVAGWHLLFGKDVEKGCGADYSEEILSFWIFKKRGREYIKIKDHKGCVYCRDCDSIVFNRADVKMIKLLSQYSTNIDLSFKVFLQKRFPEAEVINE